MNRLDSVSAEDLGQVRALYKKVDAYQPVYGFEKLFSERAVSRGCVDRCELLKKEIGPAAANLRVLDVGSSMGYLSLFLSDLGCDVVSIDVNQDNINFSKAVSRALKIKSNFSKGDFSFNFCKSIQNGQYDIVLIFSVLHHIVHALGLSKTQEMLDLILDKVDVLYVELANKTENVKFPWRNSQPEDELAIFASPEDLHIEKIGRVPALGETVMRNIYKISRRDRKIQGLPHKNFRVVRSRINGGQTRDRKYYESDAYFTKCFNIDRGQPGTYARFVRELTAYQLIGPNDHFQRVLGYGINGSLCSISFPRLTGKSIDKLLDAHELIPLRPASLGILSILRAFRDAGLYWNDLRDHNLILEGRDLIAFDLEFAEPSEQENTLNSFLWLIYGLQTGQRQGMAHRAFQQGALLIPAPPIPLEGYDPQIRDLAEKALSSANIREFLASTDSIPIPRIR